MNPLTIRHLRYLDALATARHFGRAAAASAISQPALSLQIKELEAIMGAALVERGAREARLTPLGEAFAARAREILRAMDDLAAMGRSKGAALAGPLRLGLIPTIAPYLLPALMTRLARSAPALELIPRETVTGRLIAELLAGRLDAAVVALPVSEPALTEMALFDEAFVLVRPAQDAARPVPAPDGLRLMRLLLLEEGHCFRDQALSFCTGGAAPRDVMEGSSLSTLVQMVGAGLGVTLIPQMAVAVETRHADVAVAALAEPAPARRIGLVWRRSNPLIAQFEALGAEVIAAHEGLI